MLNTCPSDNSQNIDQSGFWSSDGIDWDAHRIGWAIAGGCAALTVLISLVSVYSHCRNYTNRNEQRQILRILYMPPVYAIVSFFSYRFFRSYTYYSFAEVAYEAVTLSAFLLLLIEYVAATASSHQAENAIARKDKQTLPIPFCCWRYRPTKAYFMYTIKWSVLQYVIIRPLVSIVGIICEKLRILCESMGFDFSYANVYLEIVDFISISVALYGLLLFYALTHSELEGKRPLAKFLCIKLIVMFTFYQSFMFSLLEGRVIHETQYWSKSNISNGLNALAICIEMVFFAGLMWWAYPVREYKTGKTTSIWRPLWDSVNFMDFAREIYGSLQYFFDAMRGKTPSHTYTATDNNVGGRTMDFGQAFGVSGTSYAKGVGQRNSSSELVNQTQNRARKAPSYDEEIGMGTYQGQPPAASGNFQEMPPPRDERGRGFRQDHGQAHPNHYPPPAQKYYYAE